MALRNFWFTAKIDGRKTELSGGPQSREGGMRITIRQRDNGASAPAVVISCHEAGDDLFTSVTIDGETYTHKTHR